MSYSEKKPILIAFFEKTQYYRGGRFYRNTSKSPKNKMTISPPTRIYIVSIFYRTKNQVRGLCVGRDMAILQSAVKIDLTPKHTPLL